ncbi:hypothetical protein ABK046_34920 [Streptomyces caeruleatus]
MERNRRKDPRCGPATGAVPRGRHPRLFPGPTCQVSRPRTARE